MRGPETRPGQALPPRPLPPPQAGMGTLGADEQCNRCGVENVVWSAPSPLWNLVMRGNDIDGDPKWGDLVCIRCFIVLAEAAGVRGRWRVAVDPEPEGLVKVTPSGRAWDDAAWLWRRGADGNPVLPSTDREALGRLVRAVWIEWAKEQANPKPSWLVEWEGLSEPDREADRRIGERVAAAALRDAARPADLLTWMKDVGASDLTSVVVTTYLTRRATRLSGVSDV